MNENKFLKNLSRQNSSLPANTNQSRSVEPPSHPTSSVGTEYDPIKRLTDELSRQSRAIEGLNTRIDQMEGRPQAATQEELNTLLEEAREGVSFTIDSASIARLVLPDLMKGMPSSASLKAAADAGASAITAAGTASAERIEQAGAGAASRIEWASRSKANAWANRVGFTSWQAAAAVFALLLLCGLGTGLYVQSYNHEIQTMRIQDNASRVFTGWIQEKYPEVWKAYLKSVEK